ncbi:MAG: hypothetical protein Q4G49_05955 [Paracoccus sp. (in: a-proteobacteria)]|nr:hypothetical protein [Paracoccus sp. (in: a-proteobacteria)]
MTGIPSTTAPRPRRRFARVLLAAGLALTLGACAPSAPRAVALIPLEHSTLDQPRRQSLLQRAHAYDRLLRRGELAALRAFDPPRLAQALAAQSDQAIEMMRQADADVFGEGATGVLVLGRLTTDQTRIGLARDGSPFALIPTRTLIAFGRIGGEGAATEVRGVMLAFPDNGHWYFLRLNNAPTEAMLTRAYPQFRHIPLPRPAGDGS